MQHTHSYIHTSTAIFTFTPTHTFTHFLSFALSARQTIDLQQRQTPGLSRQCVLACAAVHSGSVRLLSRCLVRAVHLLGVFFQLNKGKQINQCWAQLCWLWVRRAVTWQVCACNFFLHYTVRLSEPWWQCFFEFNHWKPFIQAQEDGVISQPRRKHAIPLLTWRENCKCWFLWSYCLSFFTA